MVSIQLIKINDYSRFVKISIFSQKETATQMGGCFLLEKGWERFECVIAHAGGMCMNPCAHWAIPPSAGAELHSCVSRQARCCWGADIRRKILNFC